MKHNFTKLVLVFILFISYHTGMASHIMGGNLRYTYVGLQSNGNYRYTIELDLYRFCGTATPPPSQLPVNMKLGVYNENPANPGALKTLQLSTTAPLDTQFFIQPPLPNDTCTFTANACVEEGIYIITIDLPPSTGGYHLIMDRCCRNGNIQNVDMPSNEGEAWYAFIPATSIVNSSPIFAVAPTPYICANDTNTLLNSAFDPDGDSLSYEFVTPYAGTSDGTNSNPNMLDPYPNWPIPSIVYAAGYSFAQPFGAGGSALIDPTTGLTTYFAPNQGYYVVAVEIKEYRNGFLVGISRLDFQLIVITCPINPAPQPSTGSTSTTFSVQEGQSLCFNISYNDLNGDSLSMTHSGLIFSAPTNPPATLTNVTGDSTITTQFCWPTSCLQGANTPYNFTVTCADNGCPPKTISQVYTIYVIPFNGVGVIQGPDTLCSNQLTGLTFTAAGTAGSTYTWTVNNGTQISGGNTGTIGVNLNATGPYSVSVTETNAIGCAGNTVTKNIFVKPQPTAIAGIDHAFCSGGSAVLGTSSTAGYAYSWSPATGLSSSSASNPSVTLVNPGSTPTNTSYILTTSLNGCANKDTVVVTVNPIPVSNAGNNQFLCSGSSLNIGTISTTGYTYSWSPSSGLSSSTISNPSLTWITSPDTLNYTVTTTNSYLCTSTDNVQIIVHVLPPVVATPSPASVCPGSPSTLTATGANTYSWALLTAPGTPIGTTNPLVVNPAVTTSYIVTGTSTSNCVNKDTITVTILPAPVITATQNTDSICPLDTVILSATGGTSYTWATQSSPTTVIGSSGSLTVNPGTTTNYILTGTAANGCTNKDTITVHVNPAPLANAGNNQSLCSASSITIGGATTAGYTYSWSPSNGLSSLTISNPTLTLSNGTGTSDTTIYTVITTNQFGCTASDDVTIITNPLPVVTVNAVPTAICVGSTATLNAGGASTYSWALSTNPGTVISTANPYTVSPTTTTTYIVTGTSTALCTKTDSVTVTVNQLPSVTASAPNDSICLGDSILLTGSGGSTYSWEILGGAVISSNSTVMVNPTVFTSYVVTGTDAIGCANKDTITITVSPNPVLSGAAGTLSVCPNILGVPYWVINPNSTSTYNWIISGGTVASQPGQDTVYVDWGVAGTGTVTVTEISDLGCSSLPVVLTVNINDLLTPQTPTGTFVICANDAQGLTYTTLNTPGSIYIWHILGGTIVSGDSTSSVVVDWTAAGPGTGYIWFDEQNTTATDSCFGVSDTFQVTINPAPATSAITGPAQLCVFDSTNFSVTSTTGSAYQWTVTNGNITSGQGTNQVGINWNTSGNYSVSVVETNSYGCVGDTVNFNILINPLPAANAGSDVSICDGQSTSLLATGGSFYSWSPSGGLSDTSSPSPVANPTTTTTYIVNVTDANGCSKSDSVVVTVNSLPVVTLTSNPPSATICFGSSADLTASGGSSYSWSTGAATSAVSVSPTSTTTYTVTVTDNNTCSKTDSITVTVNSLPVVTASTSIALICNGSSATLTAGGALTYLWTPSADLSSATDATPTANPASSTIFTVTGTDANGCTNTAQVTVNVNTQPDAQFTDSVKPSCNDITVWFIDGSTNADSYFWNFGDGSTSTDQNPVHHFNFAANNIITLIVGNGGLCYDTLTVPLELSSLADYLNKTPNVFTPNGDGKNDCFGIDGIGDFKPCSRIKIFDRWGTEVYSSSDAENCWDGKANNGNDVPTGTYIYIVEVSGLQLHGSVQLLR